MTLDEFVKKYDGKGIDYDGHFGYQCMDLYRQYVKEVLEFPQSEPVIGACNVWDTYLSAYYDRISNTPDGVPAKGDIIIWDCSAGGGYGHIAVFLSGTVNSFTSLDQNWPEGSLVHKQRHTYSKVLGWLHPKELDMSDALEVCMADREKFWKERDQALLDLEKCKQEKQALDDTLGEANQRIGELKIQVGLLEKDKLALEGQVNDLVVKVESLETALKRCQSELQNTTSVCKYSRWDLLGFALFGKPKECDGESS